VDAGETALSPQFSFCIIVHCTAPLSPRKGRLRSFRDDDDDDDQYYLTVLNSQFSDTTDVLPRPQPPLAWVAISKCCKLTATVNSAVISPPGKLAVLWLSV